MKIHTCLINLITRERGVGGHEEVTPRRRDKGCDDPDEIIIHISRVP